MEVDRWAESMKEYLTPRNAPEAPSDEYTRNITTEDTIKALKSLKNKTSPGEDTIPYISLEKPTGTGNTGTNQGLRHLPETRILPQEVETRHRQDGPETKQTKGQPCQLSTHQPFELHGETVREDHRQQNTRIHRRQQYHQSWQRAYQPHKEANEHIMIINEYMKKVKDNKKLAALLLMDVEKAFDAVWHNSLLKKLHDMELPSDILRIISSFLTDRTIQVKIGNTLSEVVQLLAGTPKGSILRPLFFILYVNDIPDTQTCQVTQYADDIAIYTSHRNPRYLEAHLQKQVDELEDWYENWFIKLNAKKTQLMIITRQTSRKLISINVRNNQVEIKDSAVLLGTTLDRTMNLKPHTTNLINKCAPRIEKMRQLQNGGALKTFYTSMIRPILETGYHLTHHHKPSLEALQRIQNNVSE